MKKQIFLKNEQKHPSFNFRIIGFFGLIVFALLTSNVASAQNEATDYLDSAPNETLSTRALPALPGQKNLKTNEEVKAFLSNESVKPLPDDYEIPGYITSGQNVADVLKELEKRYPEFFGISSTQLLDAVKINPARYSEMLNENKAIRRNYDPNSKY